MSTKSFAIGDRVRWTNIDWVGTIMAFEGVRAAVRWDDYPTSPFSHPHLEQLEKINMRYEPKKGDRVRYTGTASDYAGKTGEVVSGTNGSDNVPVRWDGSGNNSYILITNLAPVDKIDTTKPLELSSGTNSSDVTFITMTSEGHILVSPVSKSGLGSGSTWTMFDTDGKFVRSETGNGFGLLLRNKVDLPYEWVEEVAVPGFGYQKLRLTKLGDKLTAVKLA